MDISKLKQGLREDLADILERSKFVERQKKTRSDAVHRLTRAEAIAIAANLYELLGWIPNLSVETTTQTTATAVNVTATVTGDETISITGLVAVPGDLLTANFDELAHPSYLLFDEFSGDSRPIESREALTFALFEGFTRNYRERYEFVLTDPVLRKKALLKAQHFDEDSD
ncbi:MAG TPA: hypothetical protein DCS39_04675 [Rhodobiaceae bacterium]|nr:hypothetical protein [Rhodobiaceae bacterium]